MKKLVRLSKSCVGQEEKEAACRAIDAGFLGMGQEVQAFEQELRAYIGTDKEVICVNTGTAALHLAIECLGIGPGDEVLVPSITYVASFQAVAASGARPIACDVTEGQVFIDLKDAERRITRNTKAIMPVHYASDSQYMDKVYEFAAKYELRIVEDAAHAFGCMRDGKRIGVDGDVLCFSFDGIKNITSGEGGAVVTSDSDLVRRIKDARLLGVERDTEKRYSGERSWVFDVSHRGYRYHMSNIMAAIGRAQLGKVDRFASHRRNCVTHYRKALSGLSGLKFLDLDYINIVPHIFVVRVLNGRDMLMTRLRDSGIECGLHYYPNHLLRYFSTNYRLPVAERLGVELLTLPLHADLEQGDLERVVTIVREFIAE